ncbi:RxLR effector protein [Phytophthora megakarya]|uniref:RxLR effector protein n=1 Tax=Phytophthora megakarya TaxID=4795 RepID=A0A225UZW0_9STRA|nr:RxLR effector protein [Phytophthora megakarya]
MRLPCIVMAAVSTLSVLQVPVIASAASNIALTGVMSLGCSHLVGADQSISDQSRFLRGNNIAEGDKEERGFADVVEKLMAKNLVDKMIRKNSFSALEKVDSLKKMDDILAAIDVNLASVFKAANNKKMRPEDMATELRKLPGADDALVTQAVQQYTNYLANVKLA